MKNSNNQIILTENFIINNYLKKLNFKKKESFNFENDGAYLNVSKNEKITCSGCFSRRRRTYDRVPTNRLPCLDS